MNSQEVNDVKSIAKHVKILNGELGIVQKDLRLVQKDVTKLKTSLRWSVRIIGYMAILLSAIAGKALFF